MTIDELQERFNELRGKKWKGIDIDGAVEFTGFEYVGENSKIKFRVGNDTYTVYANRFYEANIIEEVSPYADWPIDAKALFWNTGEKKCKGHFAGVNSFGKPLRFIAGMTSFTNDMCELAIYDHAELAED